MADSAENAPSVTPRVRRTIELVYGVEGVTSARVWQWPGKMAVGVRGSAAVLGPDLLRRVEAAVAAIREPGEMWEFGLLDDA